MKLTFLYPFFIAFLLLASSSNACEPNEISVFVKIHTDDFGGETSWEVKDNMGVVYYQSGFNQYNDNTLYETEVCVPNDVCLIFAIYDKFMDGIEWPGYFEVTVDGQMWIDNTPFTIDYFDEYNCPTGSSCQSAMVIDTGSYVADLDTSWYLFIPDTTGRYRISTCNVNTCNTRLWVYDRCIANLGENNEGTIFFDDVSGGCAPQAEINGMLRKGKTYYIRVGDTGNDCGNNSIMWNLTYLGPISGCTDPNSCNFNPLAAIDDGSCIPQGSDDCPEGPDLVLDENKFVTSIYLSTINTTDACLVDEGCLTGYGLRDIIRFDTKIENNGELDYFIGEPIANTEQFTYHNCHQHYHYDGYAEYLLFDEDANELPIGFKNGFCVIDLGCEHGGTAQYSCEYMGISAGCYDEYWAELECQWIDITDVPDGRYIFVTRINWDNAPDALGRKEKNMANNWAQACLIIDRTSGSLEVELDDDCPPYIDCNGDVLGNAQIDCTGECGGATLMGDLDANGAQEMTDAQLYVSQMLGNDVQATTCNDLNADGFITVYDAALLSSCINYGLSHIHTGGGAHDHCKFPDGIINFNNNVRLSILDFNQAAQYVDIGMFNNTTDVVAYQFEMSGITIQNVENLVDPAVYPIVPFYSLDGQVIGISFEDSLINKTAEVQPLCRIYYSALTADEICIDHIVDIVNGFYEQTLTTITDGCVLITSTGEVLRKLDVRLQPNPFSQQALLQFDNPDGEIVELQITDINGRLIRSIGNISGEQVSVQRADLLSGLYFYRLKSDSWLASGKMVVQ